ncbi:MAG: methionine biosynthesis protein MetW [Desulfobacterales bacterium]|uniref:Methionine biosynthesis protein MetW n=1 Tax=Candidatus Desulfatibia vada TaxID=2841696 RepID=A0A8J6TQC4_9BACT|nr:methionine biosynthesis protein MetW [Candidatus Desulfatibia vada]
MRYDLKIIASWIEPGSKVLDLGCGEGDLLHFLKQKKQVAGTGIERRESRVARCIEKGLSALQGDINAEVLDYPDNSFDYVILSQTLQQVYEPAGLIRSLLRIGKKGIVSFPNFSYWTIRLQLLLSGYAPITRQLPYEWYDTPNIRVITIKDFRKFAREVDFKIIKEVAINTRNNGKIGKTIKFMPNLCATYGIFLIGK